MSLKVGKKSVLIYSKCCLLNKLAMCCICTVSALFIFIGDPLIRGIWEKSFFLLINKLSLFFTLKVWVLVCFQRGGEQTGETPASYLVLNTNTANIFITTAAAFNLRNIFENVSPYIEHSNIVTLAQFQVPGLQRPLTFVQFCRKGQTRLCFNESL